MPEREYKAGKYRYGFNGKENDDDIGEGIQDYGMRIYDRRLARFLSVDPLAKQYPELTTYQFASNSPIFMLDVDGLEGVEYFNTSFVTTSGSARFPEQDKNNVTKSTSVGTFIINNVFYAYHNNVAISFDPERIGEWGLKFNLWWNLPNGVLTAEAYKTWSRNEVTNNVSKKYLMGILQTEFGMDKNTAEQGFSNTFRHYLWQSLSTMLIGKDLTKDIADFHEIEGLEKLRKAAKGKGKLSEFIGKDNAVDIINNHWGREYGSSFNSSEVLKDINSFVGYMNNMVSHILNTVDAYKNDSRYDAYRTGEKQFFSADSDVIKQFYQSTSHLKGVIEDKKNRVVK